MKMFLVVLMWMFLVIVYLMVFGILHGIIGYGAVLGLLTGCVGYGLWRLGRAWSRSIRK